MKKIYLFAFFVSLFTFSHAQDFSTVVAELSGNLNTVTNTKEEISQTVTEVQPGVLQVEVITTNLKSGKAGEKVYEFNMADIDINTVKAYSDKDIILVQLLASKKQDLIKNTEDREKISYQDAVAFFATDINNGRKLEELFKQLIPIATEITEKRLSLSGYEQHVQWLENNIGNVALIDRQYNQSIVSNPNYPGRLELKIDEVTSKKTVSNAYHFNLANINPNSLVFEIDKDVSIVNLETRRKLDAVKTFSDGEQDNYSSSFVIYCESIEQARDIQKVLKEAILLSEKKIENTIPTINSIGDGLQVINNYISNVTINDTSYAQSFEGDCVVKFTKTTTDPKKVVQEEFFFNFKDLNKNVVKYSTKKKNIMIDFQTVGKNDFLKNLKDGEQQNYTDAFSIELAEIEDAIVLENVFKQVIEICENKKVQLSNSKAELISQLAEQVKRVDDGKYTYDQTFTSEDNTKFQFKTIEISDKSSTEEIFEGNFKDLNPISIKFETKSKSVYVTVSTNYMEKIIQYYEDGAIKNYQDTFQIQAANIENARMIATLLKKIVEMN